MPGMMQLVRTKDHPRGAVPPVVDEADRVAFPQEGCSSASHRAADIRSCIDESLHNGQPARANIRFDAVLFDLDRTLFHFDSSRLWSFANRLIVRGHERLLALGHRPPGLPRYANLMRFYMSMACLRSFVFRREIPIVEVIRFSHARLRIRLSEADAVALAWTCEDVLKERLTVDPESRPLLETLHNAGLRLGLVSNTIAPHFLLDDYLKSVHLLDYLPTRVYSSDVAFRKPHREIFRRALERLGVSAERTVFVGDRMRNDVKGAARLGMTTILVSPTGRAGRSRFRPDHIVRRLSEIPCVLGVQV